MNAKQRGKRFALFCLGLLFGTVSVRAAPNQFVLFNLMSSSSKVINEVREQFTNAPDAHIAVGVSRVFSYLALPREQTVSRLKKFLADAQAADLPVVVQLDGENWWKARPDLWNWWNPQKPGFSPSNRFNVEWTGWSADDAIKIAWRNWGRKIRVLPPPNLMSPAYRAACRKEMQVLVPIVVDWWRALPANQKYLFVGLKVGYESSIGVNAWYYPNGNRLLDRPPSADPTNKLVMDELPSRGMTQIGYAAVKTAGIQTSGKITEADLAEVVRRHLDELCRLAAELGVPRSKLFTHAGGWTKNGLLYQAGVNRYSCPGWSFYHYAGDPQKDVGVQMALRESNAPYWAAVEYLYQGPQDTQHWYKALNATLSLDRCRYVCIFNYEPSRNNEAVLQAVREIAGQAPISLISAHSVKHRKDESISSVRLRKKPKKNAKR